MLRTAIVGLGSWGRELVMSAEGSSLLRYTVACTRSPAKVEAFCRERGIALVSTFDAVLDDPNVDAVVLATPNSQHAAQVIRAAQAGKHVFVEKPFALDAVSAREAIACREAGGCRAERRVQSPISSSGARGSAARRQQVTSALSAPSSTSSPRPAAYTALPIRGGSIRARSRRARSPRSACISWTRWCTSPGE